MDVPALSKYLKEFGFTLYESKILAYLLINEEASAVEMSRRLSIPNTKIYYVLDKLVNQNYLLKKENTPVIFYIKSRKHFFDVLFDKYYQKIESLKKIRDKILREVEVYVHTKIFDSYNEFKYYLSRDVKNIKIICPVYLEKLKSFVFNKKHIVFCNNCEIPVFMFLCDHYFMIGFFEEKGNFLLGFITSENLENFGKIFV